MAGKKELTAEVNQYLTFTGTQIEVEASLDRRRVPKVLFVGNLKLWPHLIAGKKAVDVDVIIPQQVNKQDKNVSVFDRSLSVAKRLQREIHSPTGFDISITSEGATDTLKVHRDPRNDKTDTVQLTVFTEASLDFSNMPDGVYDFVMIGSRLNEEQWRTVIDKVKGEGLLYVISNGKRKRHKRHPLPMREDDLGLLLEKQNSGFLYRKKQ